MFVSRRNFLAGAAALGSAPALGAPSASGETDVAIIGAGAAGIAAARKVAAAGRRFTLIEASDRVGGRCVTDTRTFGVPFDRGAHWVRFPDINPVTRLAGRSGLDIYPAPPGQKLRIGKRNAREGEIEDFLATLVRANRAIQEAARGKADWLACKRCRRIFSTCGRQWNLCSGHGAAARDSMRSPRWILPARSNATSTPFAGRVMARCWRGSRRIAGAFWRYGAAPAVAAQVGRDRIDARAHRRARGDHDRIDGCARRRADQVRAPLPPRHLDAFASPRSAATSRSFWS